MALDEYLDPFNNPVDRQDNVYAPSPDLPGSGVKGGWGVPPSEPAPTAPVQTTDITGVQGWREPGQPRGGSGSNLYGNKQAFKDAWLASGGRTVTDLANFVKQHPEFGASLGGSKGDKVYGPGNSFWADAVMSAGDNGGQGGYWGEDTGGGGGTPNEFSDPWGSLFEKAIGSRLDSLNQNPSRDLLDKYLARLDETDKRNKANADAYVASLRTRIADLQKPPYTSGEEAVLRAKAFDQLERRRQETLKNSREDVYARGFAPTSGLVAGQDNQVNNRFEQTRGGIESDLLQSGIEETQTRADKATALEGLIQQALNGADLGGLQMLSSSANVEDQINQERQQREREILSTIGLPLDLMSNRQQLANQTLGVGGNPQSIVNSIMALLGQGQQNRNFNYQGNANNAAGMGQLLSILFPSG